MDVYNFTWESAWDVVTKTVSYTNHTVMPEALECWNEDLFSFRLPRIHMIVKEINRRLCEDLWKVYPGDWDRISKMAIIAYSQVRMANLSVVASHTVNGVSALHSDILKKTIFHHLLLPTVNSVKQASTLHSQTNFNNLKRSFLALIFPKRSKYAKF